MKRILKAFTTLVLAAAISVPAVAQADETGFRSVQKWAVSYNDRVFDRVEGEAWCNWTYGQCDLTLVDPMSYDKVRFTAMQIGVPYTSDGQISMNFFPSDVNNGKAQWPSPNIIDRPEAITGDHRLAGGGSATINLKHDGKAGLGALGEDAPEADTVSAPEAAPAPPDYRSVYFSLRQHDEGGDLEGNWSYYADPLTRRHGDGTGPLGVFEMLPDNSGGKGGLRAVMSGGLTWHPLPPRIVAAEVMEDQAAFAGSKPKYTHARHSEESMAPILFARSDQPQTTLASDEKNFRTLVIFGQDLPTHFFKADTSITPVGGVQDELRYRILAAYEHGKDSKDVRVGRVRKALTARMSPNQKDAFDKLDSAVVDVFLREGADAGEKRLSWGGEEATWNLQYGDNTADVRIIRPVTTGTVETVPQIVLPEQVMLEVEVGSKIADDTLPLQMQYRAGNGPEFASLTATRIPDHPTLYRTAPFVVTDTWNAPRAAKVSGDKYIVSTGATLRAGVLRAKTHFLRSTIAEVTAAPPDTLWVSTLKKAAACDSKTFDEKNWPAFAKTPADTVTWTFGTKHGKNAIPITYGDHAAMLLLRDSFVKTMKSQLNELGKVSAADDITDGWYRSMHDAVTLVPDYPLASFSVDSPAGPVPFAKAYDDAFAEGSFHISTTEDGASNAEKWRRTASRSAIEYLSGQMRQTLSDTNDITDCDRKTLLGLTGNGFQHVAARINPLLMMVHRPDQEGYTPGSDIAQPDRLARAYVSTLDNTAEAVAALKNLSTTANTAVVAAALTVLAPGVGAVWGEAVGTFAGIIGGLAVTGYDAGYQIYNTYQEHEEVRFAFSSVSTLGFDRYFDAAARATPWWQTGALIFTEAVLQGYSMKVGAEPIAEGLSAWRGERIALQRNLKNLDSVRGLTQEEQRDLAMFFFREQRAAMQSGVMGDLRNLASRIFNRLGIQARGGTVEAETGNVAALIEEDAAEAEAGLAEGNKPSNAKALKDEAAAGDLVSRGRKQVGAQALEEAEEAGGAAVQEAAKGHLPPQAKPWPDYKGMPVAPGKWSTTIGGKKVAFEVEDFLAEGEMCAVYKLKKPPKGIDVSSLGGDKLVLKIVKNPQDIEAFTSIPEARQNILQRMIKARDLLRGAKIPQADFIALENSGENAGIILQKQIKIDKYPTPGLAGGAEFVKGIEQGKRLAILKLYKQMSDKGLVWLDGHVDNIYLEEEGGQWVAKILDQDLITTFDEVQREGIYKKMLEYVKSNGAKSDIAFPGAGYDTAQGVMLKMLELKGYDRGFWINFSFMKKEYLPGLLLPEDVWTVFKDLPYTKPASMR